MIGERSGRAGRAASAPRGVALLVALLVLVVLVALILQFTYTTTIDLKLARNQSREMKSYYAARGVVALARAQILGDLVKDGGLFAPDSFQDDWAGGEAARQGDGTDSPGFPAGGIFRKTIGEVAIEYSIVDEDRKICLNNLSLEELHIPDPGEAESPMEIRPPPPGSETSEGAPPPDPKALAVERREMTKRFVRGILVQLDVEEEAAEELAAVMEEGAPYGSLSELLSIDGVTEKLLHGYRDDSGRRPGLVDFLTVHSMGEVNINTAPPEVLVAILSTKYGTDAAYLADRVEEFRTPPPEEAPPEDGDGGGEGGEDDPQPAGGIFSSVDQLSEIQGLGDVFGETDLGNEEGRKKGDALRRQLTVRSRFFSVTVRVGPRPPRKEYRFVLKRGLTPEVAVPVLLWEERELPPEEGPDSELP